MWLIAVFLLTGVLGSPSAIAEDRSDVMLRAFQDACFPRLDDLLARRQRVKKAGFAQVPIDAIPELKLWFQLFCSFPAEMRQRYSCEATETYQGQRDGFELVTVLQTMTLRGKRIRVCNVYDFGAAGSVGEKKVAEWIGRPADRQTQLRPRSSGWAWVGDIAALPGGHHRVLSTYETATRGIPWSAAVLSAVSSEPAAK